MVKLYTDEKLDQFDRVKKWLLKKGRKPFSIMTLNKETGVGAITCYDAIKHLRKDGWRIDNIPPTRDSMYIVKQEN